MKNIVKFGLVVFMMICFALVFTACDNGSGGGGGKGGKGGIPKQEPFNVTDEEGGTTLVEKLAWINENAKSNVNYIIEINADESVANAGTEAFPGPGLLSYSGKTNIGITLTGVDEERIISLSKNGSLFSVGNGVTLTLGENITLEGRDNNNGSLVRVEKGSLIMNTGSKITDNFTSYSGAGVILVSGTFTMNGGEISGNTSRSNAAISGGGVTIYDEGTFIMNDGKISGNRVYSSNSAVRGTGKGGGVYISGGTFTMNGGEISNNTTEGHDPMGGGVCVNGGTFTMNNGKIFGNKTFDSTKTSGFGGGVYLTNNGTFTMNNGEISGNDVPSSGGGVYVDLGTFCISNGIIYGSSAEEGLRNTAAISGAALFKRDSYNVTTQHGTFKGSTFTSLGNLDTTENTIKVDKGVLQSN